VRVTPRQREILKLSSKGLTEKEIAQQLGVSPATVRTHLERFYKSNGLRNKAEAIAFWLRAIPRDGRLADGEADRVRRGPRPSGAK
jgi:DNA-binding CsgD family transcriptional regulator